MSFLRGENMVGGYGGADILKGCTIDVNEGEIAVIVGPNGAGKSTAMKALLGMLDLKQGAVTFRGKDIDLQSYMDGREPGAVRIVPDRAASGPRCWSPISQALIDSLAPNCQLHTFFFKCKSIKILIVFTLFNHGRA